MDLIKCDFKILISGFELMISGLKARFFNNYIHDDIQPN